MNSSFWSIFSQREANFGTFDNVSISRDPPEGSCALVEEVVGGLVGLIVCLVGVVVVVRRNMEAVQNILGQIQNLLTTLTSATRQIFQSHELPPPCILAMNSYMVQTLLMTTEFALNYRLVVFPGRVLRVCNTSMQLLIIVLIFPMFNRKYGQKGIRN